MTLLEEGDKDLLVSEAEQMVTAMKSEFSEEELEKMSTNDTSVWLHTKLCFPLLTRLVKIVCVRPSSTASCERDFSGLKLIKTRLRSTGQPWGTATSTTCSPLTWRRTWCLRS